MVKGTIEPGTFAANLHSSRVNGQPSMRLDIAMKFPPGHGHIASWGLHVPLKLGANANAIQTTAPGRFRLERCRLDQNDERIPNWLTSEYRFGEGAPHWPKWRNSGMSVGPGPFYRIWKATAVDVSPVFCDQGEGDAAWFDLTDRGAKQHWGLTVRLLRPSPASRDTSRQAVRVNLETGLFEVQFHDAAAPPLSESSGIAGLSAAANFIFHDGWRPPLSGPELTREQFEKFIDGLNYGENYGLCALRFRRSISHKVKGRKWMEEIRDLGIEPREILYGMQWNGGLANHSRRLRVTWVPNDLEGSVRRIIQHYK